MSAECHLIVPSRISHRTNTFAFVLALVVAAIGAAACGGGSIDTVASADAATETPLAGSTQKVAVDDMALMVLPLREYGGAYAAFQIVPGSGAHDNAYAAKHAAPLTRTAADYDRWGRISGYALDFGSATVVKNSPILVGSSVGLFTDDASAHDAFAREYEDLAASRGLRADNFVEDAWTKIQVAPVADEVFGARVQLSADGAGTIYVTRVAFRRGRLIAGVNIARTDEVDIVRDAESLLRALDTRVVAILHGDFAGTPVPLPTASPTPSFVLPSATRPPNVPDLAAVAIAPTDLPAGYRQTGEGYSPGIAFFHREFAANSAAVAPLAGTTVVLNVGESVQTFTTPASAAAAFGTARARLSLESLKQLFTDSFQRAGTPLLSIAGRSETVTLGDDAAAFNGTVVVSNGTLAFSYIAVRSGTAIIILTVTASPSGFVFADILPLTGRLVDRAAARTAQ